MANFEAAATRNSDNSQQQREKKNAELCCKPTVCLKILKYGRRSRQFWKKDEEKVSVEKRFVTSKIKICNLNLTGCVDFIGKRCAEHDKEVGNNIKHHDCSKGSQVR
jgi:hypothetical protein